jgi:hypothetical protein
MSSRELNRLRRLAGILNEAYDEEDQLPTIPAKKISTLVNSLISKLKKVDQSKKAYFFIEAKRGYSGDPLEISYGRVVKDGIILECSNRAEDQGKAIKVSKLISQLENSINNITDCTLWSIYVNRSKDPESSIPFDNAKGKTENYNISSLKFEVEEEDYPSDEEIDELHDDIDPDVLVGITIRI